MDSWLVVASTTWMRTIHPQGPSDLPEPFSLGQTITWPMRCQVTPPNMSTDTVYDNMDLAAKSRGKDKRLMSQVNAALAYATPSTPARARANRRADRQQQQQPVSSSTYNTAYRVPYQVPYLYVSPDRYYRQRSVSPNYLYRRPVGGRARARTSRRAVSEARDVEPLTEPARGRAPIRASPVRYLPWYISPQREAQLALSPTRLDSTRSRDLPLDDYPYIRGYRFVYPYRSALWGRSGRYPLFRGRMWGYPYIGSKLSGYPFGNTKWIVSPSTAATLGVAPVRAGREGFEPLLPSRWFWGPYDAFDYDFPRRGRNWPWSLYDPRFDITPAEATRFGIDATTAAKWNAASPIRTGRWDMAPAEGMTWDAPEEPINWNVYPLRAGSPRGRRSVSPQRNLSRSLSREEAARWGITPSEAAFWDMYPSSRGVSLDRYERARSLSPSRYDWELTPAERTRIFPRSRSLSPYCRYGVDPPYSVPRWFYPLGRARSVSPVRFSPLPMRAPRHYATPRYAKKAIVPTKAARRAAARRYGYVPRPPVVFVYLSDKDRLEKEDGVRRGRLSPGTVAEMLKRFEPRKPYEGEYSGKVAAARAIARAMTIIPQGPINQAAIISPNVEIETKRKKGPKSKYAAAVMRELRLNPKQRQIIYT
ncbi:uncharacterized protein LOC135466035 isoform X4 [Liolophura sinensis]|uniref:uncharacterized protein LOC135466035 isoform X4 n=1 Tax=Liolophura sinensis TaxID=3198878 RepID=UPI003159769D